MAPTSVIAHKASVFAHFTAYLTLILYLFPGKPAPAAVSPGAPAQQPSPASATSVSVPTSQNPPEITSHEAAGTFKVNVRLVQVRVVVRDAKGKPIGTLHKEDFRLFDDGKGQVIANFDVQKSYVHEASRQAASDPPPSSTGTSAPPSDLPQRYVAYVFDDLHLDFGDLVHVRDAAEKNIATLQPTDRAAIFTTAGQNNLDFTDDRINLHETLQHLMPHPIADRGANPCPRMTYYLADQIINNNDQQALGAVTSDVMRCMSMSKPEQAMSVANMAAIQALGTGNAETRLALTSLKDVVRRLSKTPGQHALLLLSPGFITPQLLPEVDEVIERAARANVTISALDARGLFVVMPFGDVTKGPQAISPLEAQYEINNASADADVMAELADDTGGSFFHNSNDFDEGFRTIASAPEYYYVLAFSPQNLKLNGRFHKLKVTLSTEGKFSIQARRGYFAPNHAADHEQEAQQEIEEALFSQEEMRDLPVDLHTQFFKPSDSEAKLTVLAHIDVRPLHFRKTEGRNNGNLTIVSGLFDRNGNFVTGSQKTLEMHLKDDTLANKMNSGLDVRSQFDVKPGRYLVRLVVRDEEGQIAAQNSAVQIP
jgi:VWFA-related protein